MHRNKMYNDKETELVSGCIGIAEEFQKSCRGPLWLRYPLRENSELDIGLYLSFEIQSWVIYIYVYAP